MAGNRQPVTHSVYCTPVIRVVIEMHTFLHHVEYKQCTVRELKSSVLLKVSIILHCTVHDKPL
jgi:hypothetical protein